MMGLGGRYGESGALGRDSPIVLRGEGGDRRDRQTGRRLKSGRSANGHLPDRRKPRLHATLKRNYQLIPALKWLRLLLNHVPDKYEHLVQYYGYYSNRSRGARRLAEQAHDRSACIVIDEPPPSARRKASWARLIQKVYEVDPLECLNCGATMRIIALIDDAEVIERILKHLKVWDPVPEPRSPAGPDPPWPLGETLPITYHPVPDIA